MEQQTTRQRLSEKFTKAWNQHTYAPAGPTLIALMVTALLAVWNEAMDAIEALEETIRLQTRSAAAEIGRMQDLYRLRVKERDEAWDQRDAAYMDRKQLQDLLASIEECLPAWTVGSICKRIQALAATCAEQSRCRELHLRERDEARRALRERTAELRSMTNDRDVVQAALTELQAKTGAGGRFDQYRQRLTELQDCNARQYVQLLTLRAQIGELMQRGEQLDRENGTLKQRIQRLSFFRRYDFKTCLIARDAVELAKLERDEARDERDARIADNTALHERVRNLGDKCYTLEMALEGSRNELARVHAPAPRVFAHGEVLKTAADVEAALAAGRVVGTPGMLYVRTGYRTVCGPLSLPRSSWHVTLNTPADLLIAGRVWVAE